MLLVEFFQSLALCQLEQRNFGRDEPTKEISKDDVITEGNDVLDFPKDGPAIAGSLNGHYHHL